MSTGFVCARPLQAGKLTAIVLLLPIAGAVIFGLVPYSGVLGLFLVPLLALGLAIVVVAEAVLAGYRMLRSGRPLTGRIDDRPVYGVVRVGEVVAVALSMGVLAAVLGTLPAGTMAGPGAIGLWMIMVGLALLVVGASFVRTLAEYYYHRVGAAG